MQRLRKATALCNAWGMAPVVLAAQQSASFEIRDSAGIRVVDNWRAVGESLLQASSPPILVLGADSDQPPHLFRVVGAVRLEGRSIVVANSGGHELLFFDSAGRYRTRVGRRGSGPGEFQMLSALRRWLGDTVLAFDTRLRRLSVFDAQGRHVRDVSLPLFAPLLPDLDGVFEDGALGLAQRAFQLAADGPARIERPLITLYRYNSGRRGFDSLVTVPGTEFVVAPVATSGTGAARFARQPREFGLSTVFSVDRSHVIVADNEHFQIRLHTPTGKLTHLIRRKHDPVRVSRADIARLRQERLARLRDPAVRALAEQEYLSRPGPRERLPAFEPKVLLDRQGHIWVADYHWPPDSPFVWSVFDSRGVLVATVRTPHDVEVIDAGEDYVLGIWGDPHGAEQL